MRSFNEMQVLIELTGIGLFAIATRLPFLQFGSSDTWHHLWLIRFFQMGGSLSHREVAHSFVPGYIAYPPLPHYLIARLPERAWIVAGTLGNILYDLLSLILVYAVAVAALPASVPVGLLPGVSGPGLCALLWASAPILHPVHARLRAIGGRTLGNVAVLLYGVSLYGSVIGGEPLFYLGCVLTGLFAILSSQFALQVIIFFSLGLSAIYLDPMPLIVAVIVLAVAWWSKPLCTCLQLQGKLAHYRWYLRQFREGRLDVPGNSVTALRLLRAAPTSPGQIAKFVFISFTPLVILLNAPVLVILAVALLRDGTQISIVSTGPVLYFAAAIAISAVLTSIVTAIGPMMIFGQSERYLEYAMPAFALLVVVAFINGTIPEEWLVYLLLFQLAMIFLNLAYLGLQRGPQHEGSWISPDLRSLTDFLQSEPRRRIITISTKRSSLLDYYCFGRHIFYLPLVFSVRDGLDYQDDDHAVYNLIRADLHHFRKKYGADTLIISTEDWKVYESKVGTLAVDQIPIIFENKSYRVLDLRALS